MEAFVSDSELKRFLQSPFYPSIGEEVIKRFIETTKVEKTNNGYSVEIAEEELEEQSFNGQAWYRAKTKRYALFEKEGRYVVLFQKK